MTFYDDFTARRVSAQMNIGADVPSVQKLVALAAAPRIDDTRRLLVLQRAFGDLVEALACGQDFDRELSVLGACVLEWKESRLAELAACCCPQMPGQDVIALPECPAHGEGS